MSPEIPDGLTVEPVWLVEATYGPDALEARRPFRHEHLARIGRLRSTGVVLEAGGCLDGSKAVFLLRAPDERAALELLREDVYTREGVFVEIRAHAFGRVARVDEVG